MKACICFSLGLVLLCGCSTLNARKQEKSAAYAALSAQQRDLVDLGRIEQGMDTNAVYIAWGKPSEVIARPATNGGVGSDQTWVYFGDRPVLVPAWTSVPDPYGYWMLDYHPEHHSQRYTKAQVVFRNGRVVDWKRF
jgi:hypothetical protein